MAEKTWNKNVRFNTNSESAMQAWSLLHSDEVKNGFKSQNEFIIYAINDYYERYVQKKDDPYLETREKEDAFVERIVSQVTEKILTKFANSCRNVYDAATGNAYGRSAECRNAGDEFYSRFNKCKYDGGWSTEGDQEYKKWDGRKSGCN